MQPNQHTSNHPIRMRNMQRVSGVSHGLINWDDDERSVYENSGKGAAPVRIPIKVRAGRKQERSEEKASANRR
jgi:hypothetical protein